MEELNYMIEDSTIAELLGVQNYSTDESAILELVKNAYDAGAMNVTLTFHNNSLAIFDNGSGMNRQDIMDHWMHIGKSSKKYQIEDLKKNKRVQAGSKGVGRFALARLGGKAEIRSKKAGEDGIYWLTDWNHSQLDICEPGFEHGTQILLENLREKWTSKRVQNLTKYLEVTYHDDTMQIEVIDDNIDKIVGMHFPEPAPGINCRSCIRLFYDGTILKTEIDSDEFSDEAKKYCPSPDLQHYQRSTDMRDELKGNHNLTDWEFSAITEGLSQVGPFSACLFFNLPGATNEDLDKFCYKYVAVPDPIEAGIILYRNAFSISSYEGRKDWLGLGKRSRMSPAAASHKTGTWRVKENQLSGYVLIDKEKNQNLKDLSNRQGLEENLYFRLFVEILLAGLREFERYRQEIIRKINIKNESREEKTTPLIKRIIKKPTEISGLTLDEQSKLVEEIKSSQKEQQEYRRARKEAETRYRYDVRILNVLATSGLRAASIAHEMKNDRNLINTSYENIVNALKEYGMWKELNSPEKTRLSYKNVPKTLKDNHEINMKILIFMDTMLEKIEKKQFIPVEQNVKDLVDPICAIWMHDYSWVHIDVRYGLRLQYKGTEDTFQVVLDNLILNSIQQNEGKQHLAIQIDIERGTGNLLCISYRDNGKGLDKKYEGNPRKILEVHETTRANGHGLGMWIVNNTVVMSGGAIEEISGTSGFEILFTIGDKVDGTY